MKQEEVARKPSEQEDEAHIRVMTTPECLSAAVLTLCQKLDPASINQTIGEVQRQTANVRRGDLSRVEDMLTSQAHTLDGLFAMLTSKAITASGGSGGCDAMDRYMRLALKAQNQARATLQTLAEIKYPKHYSYVNQANIGNQIQVNNGVERRPRGGKNQKQQNELLEKTHGERLDTGEATASGRNDRTVEPLERKHRTDHDKRES